MKDYEKEAIEKMENEIEMKSLKWYDPLTGRYINFGSYKSDPESDFERLLDDLSNFERKLGKKFGGLDPIKSDEYLIERMNLDLKFFMSSSIAENDYRYVLKLIKEILGV